MSKEVLLVIEAIANEKGVDRGVIVEAVESALASATKKRYPEDVDVRVDVDRRSGEYSTFRRWHVVEDEAEVEHPAQVIRLSEAQERDSQLQVGDVVEEPMESVEFGRIAAQTAKQVIVQKVREAERAQVVEA
ncbi:MAG: NusA N-terminal domain-containing protein, partial [Ectothiorhodospiraceae bacterium]